MSSVLITSTNNFYHMIKYIGTFVHQNKKCQEGQLEEAEVI